MTHANQRVILKLSGEVLGGKGIAFDHQAFEDTARMLIAVRATGAELAVVIGGGNVWRGRRGDALQMGAVAADQMGMLATLQNCLYIRDTLTRLGADATVMSAVDILRFAEPYNAVRGARLLSKGHILLLACGTGNPFFSTDTAAALRAAEIDADIILKATMVDGVYDCDPKKNPNAVKYDSVSFMDVLNKDLQVMDSTAASLCKDNHIPILVFSIIEPENIMKAVCGEQIGTIVREDS